MRRLIAYITSALTILICVGFGFSSVFTKMNPGREYYQGNDIVYSVVSKDDGSEIEGAAKKVAEEMTSRLNNWGVEDYSVKIEGNDQVRVNISSKDEVELYYIENYLSFSGGDFSLSGKKEGAEDETRVMGSEVFKEEAYIKRVNDLYPYVIFPVYDSAPIDTLINAVSKDTETGDDEGGVTPGVMSLVNKAEGDTPDTGEETVTPDIFLWSNWVEGDTYEISQKDKAVTGQKIICGFVSSQIWYRESEDSEDKTALQYLCGYGKEEDSSQYDESKLKEANLLAKYVVNKFNASQFEYAVEPVFVTQSSEGQIINNILTGATAESLVSKGKLTMSATLIATLLAIGVVSLILVMFYRMTALAIVANTLGSILLTYWLFTVIGNIFNIGAVIAGLLLAIMSISFGVVYANKFKAEVYKGRTLKKANSEAFKKINLLGVDFGVVSAFSGLMFYLLGGAALQSFGSILFFGGVISLVMNMLIFRLLVWLLTNTTSIQTNYKLFNLDAKNVPNVLNGEKTTYVAPYEKVDFAKHKKAWGIATTCLTLAFVAVISVFGAMNSSPLNVEGTYQTTTQLYVTIQDDRPQTDTVATFKDDILGAVTIKTGTDKYEKLTYSDVQVQTRDYYDYISELTDHYVVYVATFNKTFTDKDEFKYTIGTETFYTDDLDEAVLSVLADYELVSESKLDVKSRQSIETVKVPNQGYIALAAAISLLGSCLYIAFRYRPSRALTMLTVTTASAVISYGFLAAVRIKTSAITGIVLGIALIVSMILMIISFNKEKEMLAEVKGQEITKEEKQDISKKALGITVSSLLVILLIAAYIAINYFGFERVEHTVLYAGMLLAVVVSFVLTIKLILPLNEMFSKLFSKIKLPKFNLKKKETKVIAKPKTSEPEETIFIGMND